MINNTKYKLQNKPWNILHPLFLLVFSFLFISSNVIAQNPRPTPTPTNDLPAVISRDSDSVSTRTRNDVNESNDSDTRNTSIKLPRQNTNSTVKKDGETSATQKKMLLYLDLLTRTEQREASLQKQLFDMLEKQNSLNSKIKQLENQMRPDSIRSATALTGSLRPEELREQRKLALTLERDSALKLLQRVNSRITTLETSVRKAEALVERIRLRFDKVMDDALNEEDQIF